MPIRYAPGKYNRAAGTRNAFGALSADLEREGLPALYVNDGDREPQEEINVFLARYRSQASGGGAYNDVRWWHGERYVRVSSLGTVAVPGSGNHGKRRANDVAYPYSANTAAHRRAQVLAKRHNITCEGMGFREWWHWTYWGPLGAIDASGGAAASTPSTTPNPSEEDVMTAEQYNSLMWEVACLRPIKMYHLVEPDGSGGWVWVGEQGKAWIVPNPQYAVLADAQKLSQVRPIRSMDRSEFHFLTAQLLPNTQLSAGDVAGAVDSLSDAERELERIISLDPETVAKIVQGIGDQTLPVTLNDAQLAAVTDAALKGAEQGGANGAREAIVGLSFVVATGA
ncbi:hypothetical protein [Microbacterium maritypicum]